MLFFLLRRFIAVCCAKCKWPKYCFAVQFFSFFYSLRFLLLIHFCIEKSLLILHKMNERRKKQRSHWLIVVCLLLNRCAVVFWCFCGLRWQRWRLFFWHNKLQRTQFHFQFFFKFFLCSSNGSRQRNVNIKHTYSMNF